MASRPVVLAGSVRTATEDVVNVEGGAIAHGHPIGATGAVLTTRLLHSMRRDGLKRGILTSASAAAEASRSRPKRWGVEP
jgi:acetyl-CoA C-acetyltransferase